MDKFREITIFVSLAILSVSFQFSSAVPLLVVSTDKHVYEYGDFLSITLQVSELTGDPIILHIADASGKTSSPIPIQISKLNGTITAPVPFYKTNYAPGTYRIDAQYSGVQTSVSFQLIDSDKIAIPPQYKELVKSWFQGTPNNNSFAGLIKELVNFDIIEVPNYHFKNTVSIPYWILNDAKWWSDDSISDYEFVHALQFLIQKGIISV